MGNELSFNQFEVRALSSEQFLKSLHDANNPLSREPVRVKTNKAGSQEQGKSVIPQGLKTSMFRGWDDLVLWKQSTEQVSQAQREPIAVRDYVLKYKRMFFIFMQLLQVIIAL